MPVKIRLTRMGKKKQPTYRVVVSDSRKPRNGVYIEQIGWYDPRQDPSLIEIDNTAALKWLQRGAQPTDRAKKLLEISGAWSQFRVVRGDIHTISDGVPVEEVEAQVVERSAEPNSLIEDAESAASLTSVDLSEGTAEKNSAQAEE